MPVLSRCALQVYQFPRGGAGRGSLFFLRGGASIPGVSTALLVFFFLTTFDKWFFHSIVIVWEVTVRASKTKSRRLKGLQLEVGAPRHLWMIMDIVHCYWTRWREIHPQQPIYFEFFSDHEFCIPKSEGFRTQQTIMKLYVTIRLTPMQHDTVYNTTLCHVTIQHQFSWVQFTMQLCDMLEINSTNSAGYNGYSALTFLLPLVLGLSPRPAFLRIVIRNLHWSIPISSGT